jgi:hypothetical protein
VEEDKGGDKSAAGTEGQSKRTPAVCPARVADRAWHAPPLSNSRHGALPQFWTQEENSLFYEALMKCGRDFDAIQKKLPHKTREQVCCSSISLACQVDGTWLPADILSYLILSLPQIKNYYHNILRQQIVKMLSQHGVHATCTPGVK